MKLLLLGDYSVGKTAFLTQVSQYFNEYPRKFFNMPKEGVLFCFPNSLEILDSAEFPLLDVYHSSGEMPYFDGVIVIYDSSTYSNLSDIINKIRQLNPDIKIITVANKCDVHPNTPQFDENTVKTSFKNPSFYHPNFPDPEEYDNSLTPGVNKVLDLLNFKRD